MDFCFHNPRQSADVLECDLEIGSAFRLYVTGNEILDAGHHRAQFAKMAECLMSPFGQIDPVLPIEQSFDKTLQFLAAHLRTIGEVFRRGIEVQSRQPERLAALLMLGEVIPQTLHKHADQLVCFIHAVECRQFSTPKALNNPHG